MQIPISKVSHIEIGIGKDNSVSEKVKSNLKILSTSTVDDTRKGAYNDLVKVGIKAIPFIQDFYNDPKNVSGEDTYTGEYTIDNALLSWQLLVTDFCKPMFLTLKQFPEKEYFSILKHYQLFNNQLFIKYDSSYRRFRFTWQ